MPKIKRRHFLQFSASALATIGMNSLAFGNRADRYGKVLAQSSSRKLALLVGINQYSASDRLKPLLGCVNDVELQRQLLIHRFGFRDEDILMLTDAAATRQGILDGFENHLIAKAQAGDIVVFHFSGHGSQVKDKTPIDPGYEFNSTFIPVDATGEVGAVQDIMGQTLFLLMYALRQKTENVVAILDSCHSGGGTRGGTLVRAAREAQRASEAEYTYQKALLNRLGLSERQFQVERQKGVATGMVLASAKREQLAADYPFSGFYAGAFTFLLTQYLWQQTTTATDAIAITSNRLKQLPAAQTPVLDTQSNDRQPVYFLDSTQPSADALVLKVKGKQAEIWLGGVDRESFDAFGEGAILVPVGKSGAKVTVEQRSGLKAIATIEGNIREGDLLQEFARAIPRGWQMGIGLDPSLGGTARGAGQLNLQRVETVPAQTVGQPYAQTVHYILSRMTGEYRQQLPRNGKRPAEGGIGLFSPALEVIPDSFGLPGESVTDAMTRLRPKLQGLLAARIIRLTLNAQSSRLDVGITMKLERSREQILGQAFTARGEDCEQPTGCTGGGSRGNSDLLVTQIPTNAPFQFEAVNNEDKPLYLGVLAIGATGDITVLFPNEHQENTDLEAASKIEAKGRLLIPDSDEDEFVLVSRETGRGEALAIFSEEPMTEALLRLRNLARGQKQARGPVTVNDPLALILDLTQDVRSERIATVASRSDYFQTAQMATLAIAFEVVQS